jgi:hypothetical protein
MKISAKQSLGYYELKKHKPWFNEGCSKLSDQRNMPNCSSYMIQVNIIRREASRHLRNKKREYLKDKINELAMNRKNRNMRMV